MDSNKVTQRIIDLCVAYISKPATNFCLCDYIRVNAESYYPSDEAVRAKWVEHKRKAFETSPDFTGNLILALDHEKYDLDDYFQDNQLAGEYGAARIRLTKCIIAYFEDLLE